MGKTFRTIGSSLRWEQSGHKEITPIKSKQKSHIPQNKWPKRLSVYKNSINESEYEAGSGYCRSHKTRSYDNQRLNHAARQYEKRQVRKDIKNQIEER